MYMLRLDIHLLLVQSEYGFIGYHRRDLMLLESLVRELVILLWMVSLTFLGFEYRIIIDIGYYKFMHYYLYIFWVFYIQLFNLYTMA